MKSIHRAVVKLVSENVCPQQHGIGVSTGLELKNIAARIFLEERLASGRSGPSRRMTASMQTIHLTTRVRSRQRENGKRSVCRMQPFLPGLLTNKPGRTQMFTPGLRRIRPEYVSFAREILGRAGERLHTLTVRLLHLTGAEEC
jgi:hypothetical protein